MHGLPPIPTATIGSMPKPAWLSDSWYSVTDRWNLSGEALKQAFDDATRLAVADQVEAGIDILTDGEQCRPTHYSYFLKQLAGMDLVNLKAKSMRAGKFTQEVPRVVGPLSLSAHIALDDYRALRRLTRAPVKMTLPGPTTLVDGTYDAHYGDERSLALAYADVLNAEIRALEAAGCTMVQLDEPAFTRLPEKVAAYGIEALDRAFAGTGVVSCVHVCYGYRSWGGGAAKQWRHGYEELFPLFARSTVQHWSLEFAEPNLPARILEDLPGKTIQLGVVDCGTERVESPERVAARLRDALEVLPPERLIAAPDCGCVALPREVARGKLRALALGAAILRQERFRCEGAG
jgi:5-methyltetrahydropteroyltriglutamate--homocysteine methyltransferase